MGYISTSEAKQFLPGIVDADTADDTLLGVLIDAVSELIDETCGGRSFTAAAAPAATRTFSAASWDLVYVDDIGSTTDLVIATDEDADGTFETTWSASDYQTEPDNAIAKGKAIQRIRVRSSSSRFFPMSGGDRLVQVTARWGWPSVPKQVTTACRIQVSRLYARRQSPLGIATTPEMGGERLLTRLDPDVEVLLTPLMRTRGGLRT